jgi:hypothetical protein
MKRLIWSLSLTLAGPLLAFAEGPDDAKTAEAPPAASLGLPRASLGLPRPSAGAVVPAGHNEVELTKAVPDLAPIPDMPAPKLVSPYNLIDNPKPMPKAGIAEDGKDGKGAQVLPGPLVPGVVAPDPNPAVTSGGPIVPPWGGPPVGVVDGDDPSLFALPQGAAPFVGGNRFRFSAEYLMWWTKGMNVPPLVTTGPAASDGILGQPGVSNLFGNGSVGPNFRSGARFGFATFFGERQVWGIDGHYFFLNQTGQTAAFGSNAAGSPLIARPFVNLNTGSNFSEIISDPGLIAGGMFVSTTTQLWGADLNLRRRICGGCTWGIDGLLGYRFLNLNETLAINETTAALVPIATAPGLAGGTAFDRFRTTNHFNGGQIGAAFEAVRGRWSFNVRPTVAFGVTSSTLDISGAQTTTTTAGVTTTTPGGLLALNSNIGHYYRSHFAVVPEVTFNVGYDVTQHVRLFVGYNLLYWSNVIRPGDQVDTGLDVNRIPNFGGGAPPLATVRPAVPMRDRDFFAQGVNFGVMLKW